MLHNSFVLRPVNNIASYYLILPQVIHIHIVILYCVVRNYIASYDFILRYMISYCVLWFNIASSDLILHTMALYCVLPKSIVCVLWYCTIWNQKTQYYFLGRNIKLYWAIWNYKTQYYFIRRNIRSYCAI